MNQVIHLILRKMRAPLRVLITVYALSTLGLVLIPGVDGEGQPWRMDFFHAFYVISYTATEALRPGDQLLFCGVVGAPQRRQWTLQNHNVLRYPQRSEEQPEGLFWRWLSERFDSGRSE